MGDREPDGIALPWILRRGFRNSAVLFFLFSIPFVILYGVLEYSVVSTIGDDVIRDSSLDVRLAANTVGRHIEGLKSYMESNASNVSRLLSDIGASSAKTIFDPSLEENHKKVIGERLIRIVKDSEYIERSFITDPDGVEWYDYPHDPLVIGVDFSYRDWYKGVSDSKKTYVSEIYKRSAEPRNYIVSIACPLWDNQGNVIGYIVGQNAIADLQKWFKNAEGYRSSFILLDRMGKAAMNVNDVDGAPLDPGEHHMMRQILSGDSETFVGNDPVTGEESLISFSPILGSQWYIISRISIANAFSSLYKTRIAIVSVVIICYFSIGLICFLSIRKISSYYFSLKDLQESKDMLNHMIVHDLRNPLSAIKGFLQIAQRRLQPGDEGIKEGVQDAVKSADLMFGMINILVDIMRLEDGKMPVHIDKCDMCELVKSKVKEYSGTAQSSGLKIEADLPSEPLYALCDRSLTERVLANLISNAVKHTSGGGKVTVGATESYQNKAAVVWVKDTGEGIPPEHHGKIFKKYGQVELKKMGRSYDTGLGLVFSRMAVEAQKGRINFDSDLGKGSKFTLVLPLEQSKGKHRLKL